MSGRSSPMNGGYEAARLTVRKDLFPEVRLPKLSTDTTDDGSTLDEDESISCVKLETDFEQSIDEIAKQKLQIANGKLLPPKQPRHRKHKQHRRDTDNLNGCLPSETKRKKRSRHKSRSMNRSTVQVKGGKNLNLVSSSECKDDDETSEEELEDEDDADYQAEESEDSSDDEVLKYSVKLPIINVRQSGKPYSHELSQLSTRKSKKDSKEKRTHAITPCSGKPRSMLDICSSRSKKKKKTECTTLYQSQIVDTNTIKIKIRRTSVHETITPPIPTSIADIGQRKSKKKRAASPVPSESSGEEYDPSRGDTPAAMSVAAPKPRHPPSRPTKTRKSNSTKSKNKSEKTERTRISGAEVKDMGPQSPWGHTMPKEILTTIFEYVVHSQGSLPAVIRLGKVCKLWYNVSCRPELWKNVDLAQYTVDKCKTDYKLVWLLENRLKQCQSLNIAQWKVCNVSWVLACVAEYCPDLVELSIAGWSRITPEQLFDLMQALPKLQRIDLSHTSETVGSNTALSAASMARIAENFGERLTHLTLANNKFTALPQILSSVAAHCKNLEVLDISGACATSHPAAVPLEALQRGCPKVRVFRAANAQLVLAPLSAAQQMESEGWSQLEELSIAGEAECERVGVGQYRLGDEALARLVRGATRLRLLDLRALQRLTPSGLVRVPAWDLQHLFLGGCNVTRQSNACLELICEKWSHSLLELDLSWASAARVLDDAVSALADSPNSKLRILNLCGSSVSLDPVKKVLLKCPHIESLNLSSCRALPRGMKRLYVGKELQDLKDSFDPSNSKAKEEEKTHDNRRSKKESKKSETNSKSNTASPENRSIKDTDEKSNINDENKTADQSTSFSFQEPKSVVDGGPIMTDKQYSPVEASEKPFTDSKTQLLSPSKDIMDTIRSPVEEKRKSRDATPKLLSPMSKPDSSSTPKSETGKSELGSPHFSPLPKPDSQVQNSPEVQSELMKSSNSWNLGTFKTTPTHKSEASPLNRIENTHKLKHSKITEQCSPTTSHDTKRSPETQGVTKQDLRNPNSWNIGNYSPMPRQDQFSSQRSPYSAQPSPAQPSPYSAQPSPYSTQPSPYSSQPSPYSAQPSPDTSQMVKTDLQKTGAWNTGNYSPMPKHHPPFSPHPSTHTSPDPGVGVKSDSIRSNPNRTPGQYSPMSRQDRIHQSPYSPRPSVDNSLYNNKKSPGMGNYSPMLRPDCHLPSPDGGPTSRSVVSGRTSDIYGRPISKPADIMHNLPTPDIPVSWGMERFNSICNAPTSSIESLVWGSTSFSTDPPAMPPRVDNIPSASLLNTPPPQPWTDLPSFDSAVRRTNEDLSDPWSVGQFVHNNFIEQNVNFESLSGHGHAQQAHAHAHALSSYLDDSFSEASRLD
ncbi:hypothetical protein K1T71_003223 [Dendrolimus kikuchii]|uniref:Uncharacterized protein n=1 Tax=Dendrolimus kikuchii TaxID=765133 RepID=A0ACC1DC05_9NEOP|nr:hypothetical protein K1T71_003223 [Dendrolimus kikuchii]